MFQVSKPRENVSKSVALIFHLSFLSFIYISLLSFMLKISQRTFNNTAARHQISTFVQRSATRNVKTSVSVIAASTALKRQQPWKLVGAYYGSKRFYVGK
jgi:hypothetical protein